MRSFPKINLSLSKKLYFKIFDNKAVPHFGILKQCSMIVVPAFDKIEYYQIKLARFKPVWRFSTR